MSALSDAAETLSTRTNLPVETCASLLASGWTYTEELGKPHRWESPLAQFVNLPMVNG